MAKKKKNDEEDFNLDESLEDINEYLLEGFKKYIMGMEIKSKKDFDKIYKKYGDLKLWQISNHILKSTM